jgi:hypothetical protein
VHRPSAPVIHPHAKRGSEDPLEQAFDGPFRFSQNINKSTINPGMYKLLFMISIKTYDFTWSFI